MTSRADVVESPMASSGAPVVKMANDGIDRQQRDADNKGHGEETGIEDHVSGLGHIRYEQLAEAVHVSSLPGTRGASEVRALRSTAIPVVNLNLIERSVR